MKLIKSKTISQIQRQTSPIVRCQGCSSLVTLETSIVPHIQIHNDSRQYIGSLSLQQCPNSDCNGILFCHTDPQHKLVSSYPPIRIDFDHKNLPENLVETMTEAITCHANDCFISAAIMVRKTLEILCAENKAQGKDLKDRIDALKDKIIVPKALLDGLHDLRLLGNDAAHVNSKDFDNVGKEEVEAAIEVTKELLKAIYQHENLIKKLASLKKTNA